MLNIRSRDSQSIFRNVKPSTVYLICDQATKQNVTDFYRVMFVPSIYIYCEQFQIMSYSLEKDFKDSCF